MIITEQLEHNRELRYSDKNVYIKQLETGLEYESAVDVTPCKYTYEETDRKIILLEDATEEDYKNALREVGVLNEKI